MTLPEFLESLFDNGRVCVNPPAGLPEREQRQAMEVLCAAERIRRDALPAGLPDFDENAALWAAEQVYQAAQFQVHRDVNPEQIAAAFGQTGPPTDEPSSHYSVDLCFAYVFDLLRLAKIVSQKDPLIEELRKLVRPWPLSAVGIECEAEPWHAAFSNTGLRRMYVDRVIGRNDGFAMAYEPVREAIRAAVGAFPELVPALSKSDKELTS